MVLDTEKERDRVQKLLSEALPMICKNAIQYDSELCIEALIGVTLDRDKVFLVSVKKEFKKDGFLRPAPVTSRPKATSTPTRRAAVRAKERQQQWLAEDEDDPDEADNWQEGTHHPIFLDKPEQTVRVKKEPQTEQVRVSATSSGSGVGTSSPSRSITTTAAKRGRPSSSVDDQASNSKRQCLPSSTVASVSSSTPSSSSQSFTTTSETLPTVATVTSIKRELKDDSYETGISNTDGSEGDYDQDYDTEDQDQHSKAAAAYTNTSSSALLKALTDKSKTENENSEQPGTSSQKTVTATMKSGTREGGHSSSKQTTVHSGRPQDREEQGHEGEEEEEEEEEEMEEEEYMDEEEEYLEDEEEEEEGEEELMPPPPPLDIPVRIPAADVKKQYSVVKGDAGDDASGGGAAKVKYCCVKCNKSYETERDMEDHILVAHMQILRYSCQACGQHFGFHTALITHMRRQHNYPK